MDIIKHHFQYISLFLIFSFTLSAQKYDRVATRCSAVEKGNPILNIHVDADNIKWVANTYSIIKVSTCDLGASSSLESHKYSILQFNGGNYDKRCLKQLLVEQAHIEVGIEVTASFFDEKNETLWLGTNPGGLFQFKTEPNLALVDRFTTANSKLKTNEITTLFEEKSGRLWVGSAQGIMYGTQGKWKYDLNGYNIKRIRMYNGEIYALGEDEIWKMQANEKWVNIPLDERWYEKDIRDFDFESDGSLWLLSSIVARVDLATDAFVPISGPENYTSEYGRCIAVDQNGDAWVGTIDKGLFIIEKSTSFSVACIIENEISCGGNQKDGALKVKVSNTDGLLTYKWSDGLSGDNPKNLGAGSYSVTVTDKKGMTKTAKATLIDPHIEVVVSQLAPCSKDKSDGKGSALAKGGKGKYVFVWDNGEKSATAEKLSLGKHFVTTTDANGCSSINSIEITENISPLTATLDQEKEIKCHGEKSILRVNIKGGKAPFKYTWNDANLKGEYVENIGIGDYQVSVVDAIGAKATAFVSVGQPDRIVLSAIVTASSSTGKSDGKALASAKGGKGKFTFAWDNGETSPEAIKLAPGAHTVTVMDAVGCVVSANLETKENVFPLVATIDVLKEIKCYGNKSALKVNVSGGKSPYTFAWSNPSLKGEIPQDVVAGDYVLTISDASGSKSSLSVKVEQPESLTATAIVSAPSSLGKSEGKATVTAKGGKGKYTFIWDNSENTATATKLIAGNHSVTISDANGCTTTTSVVVNENISQLTASIEATKEIKCYAEKTGFKVNILGGKGPFTYQWSDPKLQGENVENITAGDYTLQITDAAGTKVNATIKIEQPEMIVYSASVINFASTGKTDGKAIATAKGGTGKYTFVWDNGETNATASKLGAGKHTVTVTDANGCISATSIEISEDIQPIKVTLETTKELNCNGDKTGIKVKLVGGKPPYSYTWSDAKLQGESPDIVPAGTYKLTIQDMNGTKANAEIIIEQPEKIISTTTMTSAVSTGKSDGKALATAKGGTGKYTFIWDSGESNASANKLSPGKHTVTITDSKGCISTTSIDITENILPLNATVESTKAILCNGGKTNLKTTVVGGKAPYSYTWSDTKLLGENPEIVSAGEYSLTLTDAVGTKSIVLFKIEQPEAMKVTIVRTIGATTDKTRDGRATLKVSGGTTAYNTVWDNNENGLSAKSLIAGLHAVTVTDAKSCSIVANVEIKKRILPELNASQLSNGQAVRMEQLQFEADSTNLNESCYPVMNEVFDFLEENGAIVIEIGGHTNSTPTDEFCDKLSSARAKSVADYLASKGIDPRRVLHKGYGKRKPVVSNATPEGRKKNQRVEIKIISLDTNKN
jgi:outer membrane protein OmpA-like peptidoglycan-associated protein